jgi:hypothetical protein
MRGPRRHDMRTTTITGEGRKAMAGSIFRPGVRATGMALGLAALLGAYAVSDAPVQAPAMTPVAEEKPVRLTEGEALAHAATIGARVEIAGFREETVSVFANPDGTRTTETYAQPVRFLRDGAWRDASAVLTRGADGTITPTAIAFGLELSDGGAGPLLTATRAGRSMSLDWPGELPAPSLDEHRATYAEVFPGVDLVVNVGITDFSHVLVIKTAKAALNEELASIDFGLTTEGLTVGTTADGGLAATDTAAGGAVFEAVTPTMWDSGDQPATAALKARALTVDPEPQAAVEAAPESAEQVDLGVQVTEKTLTLVPDQQMLTSSDTTFPVYVDPLWTDTRASSWAMVASGYPAQEYWKFKDDEGVGECPVSSGNCAGVGVKRIYYTLPTSFPDRIIMTAELRVTMTHTYNSTKKNVVAYRSKAGISSKTNWNNKPDLGAKLGTQDANATKGSCEKDNQNVAFDVLAAVNGKQATTTFALRAEDESDSSAWKRFCGNAILSVQWNRPPNTPVQSKMGISPGGGCIAGANRPYTDTPPVLSAVLSDPDYRKGLNDEKLVAEFKVYWTPPGAARIEKTYVTGTKASGSSFTYSTGGLSLPQNTVIGWEVRARDLGKAWSKPSTDGAQTNCEFILDKTSPAAPDIDSAVYLPLDEPEKTGTCEPDQVPPSEAGDEPSPSWRGWIGRYGTFTFDSAATDVVEYWFGFDANPSAANTLKPTSDGGPVSVTWMPTEDGPHTLQVLAKDRAKKSSTIATCTFFVATRLSAGGWAMSDADTTAADERGNNPATAGSAVAFGVPGPACQNSSSRCSIDKAVRLTGAADSYLSTSTSGLVDTGDTGGGYSVSAWVRLTDLTADRTAVSQDGTGGPGFELGFDGTSKKWVFRTPISPVSSLGNWASSSTAPALKDKWTHLVGVYDPVNDTAQLFVNGVAQPAAAKRSGWRSFGALQFGRRSSTGGYGAHWTGDLADVHVFDRIVVAPEALHLSKQRPERRAYWPLDAQVGTTSEPYDDPDGPELNLVNGAVVRSIDPDDPEVISYPLVGSGELVLDGVNDHAVTNAAVAATNTSFTISVRVRIATAGCTRTMAVVSQAGTKESAFTLRCSAANTWELVLPQVDGTDAAKPPLVLTGGTTPNGDSSGQQLVAVYDAVANEARFYVNGQLTDSATGSVATMWAAGGAVNVGRALRNSAYGDHLAGVVDELRVYGGVVDEVSVLRLSVPNPDAEL